MAKWLPPDGLTCSVDHLVAEQQEAGVGERQEAAPRISRSASHRQNATPRDEHVEANSTTLPEIQEEYRELILNSLATHYPPASHRGVRAEPNRKALKLCYRGAGLTLPVTTAS